MSAATMSRPAFGQAGRGLCLLVAFMAVGCASLRSEQPAPATPALVQSAPVTMLDELWPVSIGLYRTTSGDIYLGNLDSRIEILEKRVRAGAVERSTILASLLYHRYKVLGRLDDAKAALALLDAAIAANPGLPANHQLRAIVRAGFHQFDEALQDLDTIAAAAPEARTAARTRHEIQLALGNYDALRDEFAASASLSLDFDELAHRADLRLLQGDAPGSEFLYRAAQAQYRDVNPVPLAWLHVQQGIALLRQDRVEEARRFFLAAHLRLPQYYLATEHLAECETRLGRFDTARTLYRSVIDQTGNPEFIAALSSLERQAGNADEAQRLSREAEAGYDSLMAAYPDAFGQHAAEFLIEIGQAERADALAQANLRLRQDVGSWLLVAQTATAVDDLPRACTAWTRAVATGLRPPELGGLDALAARCR
jgi:predicted Zn-dependent protease